MPQKNRRQRMSRRHQKGRISVEYGILTSGLSIVLVLVMAGSGHNATEFLSKLAQSF